MKFWDWKTGHNFQSLNSIAQPGSLDAEAGLMSTTFDQTGLRLICGEADKTSESFQYMCPFHPPLTPVQSKYGSKTRTQLKRVIRSTGSRH